MKVALVALCYNYRRMEKLLLQNKVRKICLNTIRKGGGGSQATDKFLRKVMNVLANHPKCALKSQVSQWVNRKEK